jgi:hypothetical protein
VPERRTLYSNRRETGLRCDNSILFGNEIGSGTIALRHPAPRLEP